MLALDGGVWSASPLGKPPPSGTHGIKGWEGPRATVKLWRREKSLVLTRNWITIPMLSSPQPSHYQIC